MTYQQALKTLQYGGLTYSPEKVKLAYEELASLIDTINGKLKENPDKIVLEFENNKIKM